MIQSDSHLLPPRFFFVKFRKFRRVSVSLDFADVPVDTPVAFFSSAIIIFKIIIQKRSESVLINFNAFSATAKNLTRLHEGISARTNPNPRAAVFGNDAIIENPLSFSVNADSATASVANETPENPWSPVGFNQNTHVLIFTDFTVFKATCSTLNDSDARFIAVMNLACRKMRISLFFY